MYHTIPEFKLGIPTLQKYVKNTIVTCKMALDVGVAP